MIAIVLVLAGLFVLCVATLGIFRMSYVLNRIHVAAKCDTLGAMLVLTGLLIHTGFSALSLKLLLILVFIWLTNPVAAHLLAKAEIDTNPNITNECEVVYLESAGNSVADVSDCMRN